jgi:hypothetical protein
MNFERLGRLLITLSGSVGLLGFVMAHGRADWGRFLAVSGVLVLTGLVVLILAPTRDAQQRRRPRYTAPPPRSEPATYRVPLQRTAIVPAERSSNGRPQEPDAGPRGPEASDVRRVA